MADALVERPPARFFCHRCNIEFDHVLQDFTCPYCSSGFIEQLEADAEAPNSGDEFSDADMSAMDDTLDDSDDTRQSTPPMLNDLAFLMSGGRLRGTGRRETLMEQLVYMIGGGRGAGAGGGPQPQPFVLVGAPGDYVFGGEGLDAVVTQLLGQLENAGPPPLSRDRLQSLPSELATEQDTANTCSICWDHYQIGESISKLECEHVFHSNCITPWLQLHATCPICRRNLLPPGEQPPPEPAPSEPTTYASSVASETTVAPMSDSSTGLVGDPATFFLGLLFSWFTGFVTSLPSPFATAASSSSRPLPTAGNSSLPRVSLRRLTRRSAAQASPSDTTISSTSGLSSSSSTSVGSEPRPPDNTDRYNMDIDFD